MYIFCNSPDYDYPASDKTKFVVFSENENYKLSGNTHGIMSHALKHYRDFEPEIMQVYIEKITILIKKASDVYIMDYRGEIIAHDKDAKHSITHDMVYITMDLINDKIMEGKPLMDIEKQIQYYLNEISKKYFELLCDYIDNAIEVEKVENIQAFAQKGDILKFEGVFDNYRYYYYINFNNSGIIAQWQEDTRMINTFFRIDKKSSSLLRIARYVSNIMVFDKRLSDYFNQVSKSIS